MANLHYSSFGELVKGPSLFLPSYKSENCIVGTHYEQYGELMVGFYINNNGTIYEESLIWIIKMIKEQKIMMVKKKKMMVKEKEMMKEQRILMIE